MSLSECDRKVKYVQAEEGASQSIRLCERKQSTCLWHMPEHQAEGKVLPMIAGLQLISCWKG